MAIANLNLSDISGSQNSNKRSFSWSVGETFPSGNNPISTKISRQSLNSPVKEDAEDTIILFSGSNVRLTQFSVISGVQVAFDMPPGVRYRSKETLVASGILQVYNILDKKAPFLRCGKFVHPILPKLRMWRTQDKEFILPQPLPGKYWRIDLTESTSKDKKNSPQELEKVFQANCFYKNVENCDTMFSSPVRPSLTELRTNHFRRQPMDSPPPTPTRRKGSGNVKDLLGLFEDEREVKRQRQDRSSVYSSTNETEKEEEIIDPYSSSGSTLDKILDQFDEPVVETTTAPIPESRPMTPTNIAFSSSNDLSNDDSTATVTDDSSEESKSDEFIDSGVSDETLHSSIPTSPQFSPMSATSYLSHPLVPLATRNNILSSTFPLQFKAMDDDWLEISVANGTQLPANEQLQQQDKNSYVDWVSQMAEDVVSYSANFLTDKIDKLSISTTATANTATINPRSIARRSTSLKYKGHSTMRSPSSAPSPILPTSRWEPQLQLQHHSTLEARHIHTDACTMRRDKVVDMPDLYHQAVTVSQYMGWRILNRVITPWAKR